jgi:hypothetical protein
MGDSYTWMQVGGGGGGRKEATMMTMFAVVGVDGLRPVVWGLGETEEAAYEDAALWGGEGELKEISREQAAKVEAGDVSWAEGETFTSGRRPTLPEDEEGYSPEQEALEDEQGAEYGDPRKCPRHPHVATSSRDGMFDAPCGVCEAEMDDDRHEREEDGAPFLTAEQEAVDEEGS